MAKLMKRISKELQNLEKDPLPNCIVKINDDTKIIVCNKSLIHLIGTKIDWKMAEFYVRLHILDIQGEPN